MGTDQDWPIDPDGGALRRLRDHGMNFEKPYLIDFNIDFVTWPPDVEALASLKQQYGNVTVYEPDKDVTVQINEIVSYEFVLRMQAAISGLMAPFGGVCESWGVLLDTGDSI